MDFFRCHVHCLYHALWGGFFACAQPYDYFAHFEDDKRLGEFGDCQGVTGDYYAGVETADYVERVRAVLGDSDLVGAESICGQFYCAY